MAYFLISLDFHTAIYLLHDLKAISELNSWINSRLRNLQTTIFLALINSLCLLFIAIEIFLKSEYREIYKKKILTKLLFPAI